MITKHSADDASAKPLQIGLRLARVVSIGNGTVDVCPIGSSVVLHDIPVTSATTMSVGDVINLQVMDNKRFAFASQNAVVSGESTSSGNITIQNGDIIIAGEGGTGTGTITGVTAGNGLTGSGTSGVVTLNVGQGDGIVVSADSIAVSSDVVRTSRSIFTGSGLTGGGNLSADRTLSVALATISGLTTTSGLAIKPATGGSAIAIDASGVFLADSLAGNGLSMASQVLNVGAGSGISVNENSVSATPDTSKGISVGSNGIAINLAGTSGLNFTSGQLRIGQGSGVAVDTSSIRAVALTNGGLSVAEGGISVVEGNGIAVSAGVSAKANAEKAVVVESAGIGVVANTSLGIAVSSSGVGINKKETASGLKFDASDGTRLGLDLANPSGLSFFGNGLQIDDTIAGDGLTIGNKIISVASNGSLTVVSDSVYVNYGHMFPWTNNHTWDTNSSIKSSNAMSGFAGQGWQIRTKDSTLGAMDLDELSVRGKLRVYELLIQQIRATNGSIFVSSSAKVESVTENGIGTGEYTITIDAKNTDFCPFTQGDLLRAQRVDLGKTSAGPADDIVWRSDLTVISVNGLSFTATLRTGTTVPAVGMDYVRLGNTTDVTRRSSLYLTSDDSSAPYIDVVTGVSAFTGTNGWGTGIRARIGRLDGVTSGSDEFGIWAGTGMGENNRYIRVSSTIAEFRNVPIELFGNTGTVAQVRLTAGGSNDTPSFAMGTTIPTSSLQPAGSGVWMGQETAGGSYTFRVGSVASGALTNGILWNGSTLTVTGAINVVAGGNAETTTGAQTKADAARNAIVSTTTGKIAFTPTPGTNTGLFLGNAYMGYYNGSAWKTYMDSSGNFFLNGSGTQGLTWTSSTSTLAIDGAITARSGDIAGVLTIGTSGAIRQGTGTWNTANFTGLNIDQENSRGRIRFLENNLVRGVFGNLTGQYDYTVNLYGLAIGSYTETWISADASYGFRVMNSTTERFQVDSAGNVSIGNPAGSIPYFTVDTSNGVRVIDGGVTRFQINTSGDVIIGATASTNPNVQITSAGMNLRYGTSNRVLISASGLTIRNDTSDVITMANTGNASIAGVLNVGTSGGIYQGTGTFVSPTTGLKIWNSSGVGLIAGYNSTVVQWQAGTDGKLYAGSGKVRLDSSGATIESSTIYDASPNGINWSVPNVSHSRTIHFYTSPASGISGAFENSTFYMNNINAEAGSAINITSQAGASQTTYNASVTILSQRSSSFGQLIVRQNGIFLTGSGLNVGSATGAAAGEIKASGDVSASNAEFTGGLNVGSATGATAGQVKASAGISGTTGTFSSTLGVTGASTLAALSATTGTFSGGISVDGELESSFSATWINTGITFNTNWSNFAADETVWSFARYKRVGDLVFLRGMIKRASGTGLSTSSFTLPANFRPAKRQICAVMGLRNGQTAAAIRADVLSTGVVQFSDIDATSAYDYISLNGIVFSVV